LAAQRDVLRARIVLLAAAGRRNEQIQEALQISKPVVVKWRRRSAFDRLAGLGDQAGRGRKRKYDAAPVLGWLHVETNHGQHLGFELGVRGMFPVSEAMGLNRFGRQNRLHDGSTDAPDVWPGCARSNGFRWTRAVGCMPWRRSGVLDPSLRSNPAPLAPMKPHPIERLSYEYKRNATASLLACLEVHSGQIRAESIPRNNSVTFIRFLRRLLQAYPDKDLYVILDNSSSHRSKTTMAWVAKQKRLHLTFTPTHASWLNQIEIWFGILTRKVVRRGIFKSRDELIERLMTFIVAHNQQARPFAWT
jgi:transposase